MSLTSCSKTTRTTIAECVQCPRCEGGGKLTLRAFSEELAETLELLRKSGELTAVDLHEMVGKQQQTQPTAMNARLEHLRALGFVSRRKSGRCWLYRAQGAH